MSYSDRLIAIASESSHPLSESIVKEYKTSQNEQLHVAEFDNITGQGVTAKINDSIYFIGSERLIESNQIRISEKIQSTVRTWSNNPYSIVYFADKNQVIAAFAIGDKVKDNAIAFVNGLKTMGIMPYILSGDNESTVRDVAQQLGIDNFHSNQSPAQKANIIQDLQHNGKIVTMVGDGVNDAGALAQADIGIAMGSGTDIAMESAGITLMYSDLDHIIKAVKLSKATIRTVKQNLFWAFIYNILAIPLAAGVLYPVNGFLLHPMIAGAAMSFSSVSVLANSLRLRSEKL